MEENNIYKQTVSNFWECINKARFWIWFPWSTFSNFMIQFMCQKIYVWSPPYVTDLFKYFIRQHPLCMVCKLRDIWSASVFSCPGIWFALIHIAFPNTQFQISLAIPLHQTDLVPPMWLIYEMAIALFDIMQITLLHKSLRKDWKQNLITSNSSSLIWQFCSSIAHLPLIELTPLVPPQTVLLVSVNMVISTSLEIKFLLQSIMFSIHHLISVLDSSLIVIFASNFPLTL